MGIEKKYAPQIDSLRFFAMLSIFCNHCVFLKEDEISLTFFEQYFHYGGIGVEFFILLSGFMAGYTFKPSIPPKEYIKKRAIRLFPVHWFCLLFFIPFAFLSLNCIESKIVSLLSSILLLQSVTDYTWGIFNSASWTISTLWLMYIITPFLMRKLKNVHVYVLASILLLSVIIGFIANFYYYEENVWFFYISPFYRIVTYMQGLLLACIYPKVSMSFEKLSFISKSLFELVVIIAFILELLVVSPYSHYGYNYTLIMLLIIAIFFSGGGILTNVLSNKFLVRMSKISFSFYLVHYWVCTTFTTAYMKLLNLLPTVENMYYIFIADLIITIVLAVLVYEFIEKKFTNYLIKKKKFTILKNTAYIC